MSYGWTTESALIPKISKKIKVESTSVNFLYSRCYLSNLFFNKDKKSPLKKLNLLVEIKIQKFDNKKMLHPILAKISKKKWNYIIK